MELGQGEAAVGRFCAWWRQKPMLVENDKDAPGGRCPGMPWGTGVPQAGEKSQAFGTD